MPPRSRRSAPAAVRQADQAAVEAAQWTDIGPSGGPLVRHPDHLAAEWSFGPAGEASVRRLVRRADHAEPGSGSGAVAGAKGSSLVIGCGALARELVAVTSRIPGVDVACLAPDLHNRPDGIPAAVRSRIRRARNDGYERIFVAYADCGTGGLLEPVLAAEGVERLPGAHCYEVFAGGSAFAAMADREPGTFWLTDFLARNFERLVIRGLGIDRHPELQAIYFAHYTRVVYLSQTDDPGLLAMARQAADRLGLVFEHRPTGITNFAAPIEAWVAADTPDARGAGGSDESTRQPGGIEPVSARPARGAGGSRTTKPDRAGYARRAGAGAAARVGQGAEFAPAERAAS